MASVGTVEKATDLLFFLNTQRTPLGVTEIARALSSPKTTIHRLLRALCYRKLVEQDARGRYQLGIGLVALGLGAGSTEPLQRVAHPILVEAARALGETFFLVAVRAGELVVLDKAEGSGFLRVSPQVGASVPVHATAVGRVYLAFAPEQIHAPVLEAFTSRTPTDPGALERMVERTKLDGVATSHEEWQEGLCAIAAPIRVDSVVLGAVVAAVVAPKLKELGETAVRDAVLEAARSICTQLER